MRAGSLILFLAACIGHAAIYIFVINYIYGTRFRGWWHTGLRHLCELIIVAGPLAFLYWYGRQLWTSGDWLALPGPLLAYLGICWFLGFLVVPYQTIKRWRRSIPAMQLSNDTRTVDVAKILGHKPYGRGRYQYWAYVPGNQMFQIDLVEKTLQMPQLPAAWDGLTILQVSDLHLSGIPDRIYYEKIMEWSAENPPDIVAITGDILDGWGRYDWIIPVLGRLRWRLGAYAILGNHDVSFDVPRICRHLGELGIEMMGGRWTKLEVRGRPLVIIGNEMPWLRPEPDLSDCPAEGFRLGLCHTPDLLPWARRHRIDLMLSGHTHGGQVRLPGFGSILVPSCHSRRYDCGLFYEPPTLMYVSRGIGGGHPLRLFCRPEVTRLVLRTTR